MVELWLFIVVCAITPHFTFASLAFFFFFDSFNRFKNWEQNDKSLSVLPPISSTPNTIRNFYKYPVCLPQIEFLFRTPQYRFLYTESGLGAGFKV